MKKLYAASLGALVMAAVLLFAGCTGPLNTLKGTNPGNVHLSLAGQYARTLSPAAPVSLNYKVEFTNSGTSGAVQAPITDWDGIEPLEFDLAYGTWTITVTGIITEGDAEMEISHGSADLEISEEQPEGTVTVTMLPLLGSDGTGTLSYTTGTGGIDWTEAGNVASATLSVTPLAGGADETRNLLSQQSDSISLAPGYYIVTVSLTSGVSVASKTEVAHIYKDQTTETGDTAFVFTAEDFSRAINYADEGIYVGIIKFAPNATDITGGAPILLNAAGKSTLTSLLNTTYVPATQPGTAMFYGVHKALAALKTNETAFPVNLESVNMVTFSDGLDRTSDGLSQFEEDRVEGQIFDTLADYADYIQGEIMDRTIADKPVTAYSVGVKGSDVNDVDAFRYNLQQVANEGNFNELTDFSAIQTTFDAIANSLNITHTNTNFTLVTTLLPNNNIVRMTFDPVSSQTDPAESERYIEGTIARTGTVFALNNISYGGGISSLADEGSLSGTVIETQDNDGGTVRVVHFVFESITGIDPDVDRPNIKQWLRASSTANWEPNSEYRSDDASSSTVERKSAVIYLVLDCSNSLDSSQISQIRNATINFIDSLYTQYNAGLDPSQVGATTTVLSPGVWANGNISQYGQTKRYTFNVTAGTEYSIWWNDSAAGNSTKTLDIQVSAKYNGQTSDIFSNADSAWSTPQTFTPTANGQVIVTVQAGYYYYTGDYAIAYNWSGVNPSVPALSLTGTVSVTGAAPLGETLTADTTNLGGSGTIGYQWNRRTTETGADTAIAGATGSTYIPVVADAGKYITLTVTRIGRVGSVTSNTTAIPAISEITGAVSISGGAYIGGTLTADTASLGGSGTIGYQWNRRTTETGADTAIPGATGSTYIPVTDDAGKYITVTVTRILSTGSVTSNVTAAVTEPPCTLSWSGDWIQSSDNVYYSNSIGDNDSTLQTLSIITSTAAGCSITVTLTASSESGCDYGYASVLDGSASTSSYQLRVSGSSSNSYTYTVPAGAEYVGVHHLYFRYQKDGSLTSGDDRVTVSVTVN